MTLTERSLAPLRCQEKGCDPIVTKPSRRLLAADRSSDRSRDVAPSTDDDPPTTTSHIPLKMALALTNRPSGTGNDPGFER